MTPTRSHDARPVTRRPCARATGSVQTEVPPELGDVPGRLDVVERPLDLPVRVDDERRADHAGDRLAVELLLSVRAVRGEGRLVGVADQREGDRVPLD